VSVRPPGEWIVLPLFFISRIAEQSYPPLERLDEVSPDHPVFLNGTYSGMVNTRALDVSGLLSSQSSTSSSGKPTGIIPSKVFPRLSYKPAAKPDVRKYSEAIEALFHRYNAVGITGVTDGITGNSELEAYSLLKKENRLTVRVNTCVLPDFNKGNQSAGEVIAGLEKQRDDSPVVLEAIKIILDGGILTGTAALRVPWSKKARKLFGIDDEEFRGVLNFSQEQLTEIAIAVVKNGRKFTAHSIGDGALDMLLNSFEEANKIRNIADLHWSVIHGNFVDGETISRIQKLGVVVEFQIAWFYKDAPFIKNLLGEEYLNKFLPLRSMADKGIVLAGSSDHMAKYDSVTSINPYNPFLSIAAMVTRQTESGSIMAAGEEVSREKALEMYTINGARATGEEKFRGSIEPGKTVDMVILDRDYLDCDTGEISEIKVLRTILGGKVVYEQE